MGFLKSVKNIFFKDEIEDDYEEYDEFDEELNKHARTIKSYLDEEDYGKENEDTDNQEFDEYDESSGYETPEDDEGFDGFSDDELLVGDERDNVKLGAFDRSDLKEYVKGQCEIMEDAGRHIEMIMEEYSHRPAWHRRAPERRWVQFRREWTGDGRRRSEHWRGKRSH